MSLNDYLLIFRTNLYLLRKSNGFSQKELAAKMCVSFRTFQRLESGETIPSLVEIYKLSQIFDINPCDFINLSRLAPPTTELSETGLKNGATTEIAEFLIKLDPKRFAPHQTDSFHLPVLMTNLKTFKPNKMFLDHYGRFSIKAKPGLPKEKTKRIGLAAINKLLFLEKPYFKISPEGLEGDTSEVFGKVVKKDEENLIFFVNVIHSE